MEEEARKRMIIMPIPYTLITRDGTPLGDLRRIQSVVESTGVKTSDDVAHNGSYRFKADRILQPEERRKIKDALLKQGFGTYVFQGIDTGSV